MKKIPFMSVKPILELMNIQKQGIPTPAQPLVNYLKQLDENGECFEFTKKFHNLQENKYGDSFEEVTEKNKYYINLILLNSFQT